MSAYFDVMGHLLAFPAEMFPSIYRFRHFYHLFGGSHTTSALHVMYVSMYVVMYVFMHFCMYIGAFFWDISCVHRGFYNIVWVGGFINHALTSHGVFQHAITQSFNGCWKIVVVYKMLPFIAFLLLN